MGTGEVEIVDEADAVAARDEVLRIVAFETLDEMVDVVVVSVVDAVVAVDTEFRM